MQLRHAARFFLAVHALLHLPPVLAADVCAIDPQSIVSDACSSYSQLDNLNTELVPLLVDITQNTDFFAYYRLNLYNKICPFWGDENAMCGNRACAVETIDDEKNIPKIWRTEELGKLEGARARHPGPELQKSRPKTRPLQFQLGEDVDESCVLEDDDECDERDYCVPEDEGFAAKGDYVSLVNNTERFTGYSGPGALQVWDAIYKENCFERPPTTKLRTKSKQPKGAVDAASGLKAVFQEYTQQNPDDADNSFVLNDECLEQRAFYRIISGMHASISTHICWDYLNQTTGQWVRNVQCYQQRLHDHPERISNMYFNFALVTRAITKLRKHLEHYTFCSGDLDQDFETKQKVLELADRAALVPHTFDETIMFQDPAMLELKEDFRHRFRNVSRLMDCVGCDKCRLWGKLQTNGYGAALKVLFEFDENKNGENPYLRRTELVALVNTMARLSHSLQAVNQFRTAVNTGDHSVFSLHMPLSSHTQVMDQWPESSDEDEDEDEDDYYYDGAEEVGKSPRTLRESTGIMDEFKHEFDLIWRTYKMVLRSWVELPFKFMAIFVMEMNRLWNFWLGLPVPDRSWDIRFPSKDEL